jgi:general secretion pathway protein A
MYTEFYQFSEKPFEDAPDPKFLCLTPHLQKALSSLLTWTKEDSGVAVITGEAGTGKTLFVHALLSRLDEKVRTILIPNPLVTSKELIREIFLELDHPIQEETRTALFHRFMRVLDQMKAKGETLLVILDEAQDLGDFVLEDIQRFFTLRSKPTKTLLIGQPDFEERLNSSGLRKLSQEIRMKLRIEPLSEEESRQYIDHRLRLVKSSSTPFSPRAISLICRYAQGIPSLINHVCDNALQVGYTTNRKKIDENIIRTVIRNLEGPTGSKKALFPIRTVHGIRNSLSSRIPSIKGFSIVILVLACLGGLFFLLYGNVGQAPDSSPGKATPEILPERITHLPPEGPILASPGLAKPAPADKPVPIAKQERPAETIKVKRGQTLSFLSRQYFNIANATLVDLILDSNPEITNAHHIVVDQSIKIPKITEESFIIQSPDRTFKIHLGTFWVRDLAKPYGDDPALKGKTVEIIPRKISPTENWYRVIAGDFETREEALKMVTHLKEKGVLPSFAQSPKKD